MIDLQDFPKLTNFAVEFVDHQRTDTTSDPGPVEEARARSEPPVTHNTFEILENSTHLGQIEAERFFGYSSTGETQSALGEADIDPQGPHQSSEHTLALLTSKSPTSHKRGRSDLFSSPSILHSITSPTLSSAPTWPFKSEHEARLFHYYVKEVAFWVWTLFSSQ